MCQLVTATRASLCDVLYANEKLSVSRIQFGQVETRLLCGHYVIVEPSIGSRTGYLERKFSDTIATTKLCPEPCPTFRVGARNY